MRDGDAARTGGRALPVLLAVLVAALVVAALVQLRDRGEQPPEALRPATIGATPPTDPDDGAAGAVVAARTAVTRFYGLDHRTLDADLARVRALATPAFAAEYDAAAEGLRRRYRTDRLVTRAELVADGTATALLTPRRAEVLVAVDVVRRAGDARPERRGRRTRVDLVLADGGWRVAGLQEVS